MFEKTLVAGWGDMDFNSHMRNTAYLVDILPSVDEGDSFGATRSFA